MLYNRSDKVSVFQCMEDAFGQMVVQLIELQYAYYHGENLNVHYHGKKLLGGLKGKDWHLRPWTYFRPAFI